MIYYYVVFYPVEALIASELEPKDFGMYMARGSKKGSAERLMFAQVKGEFSDAFDWQFAQKNCVSHENGEPKHSLYLSIYRVIEQIPLDAYMDVYLTNQDGTTLALKAKKYQAPSNWKGYALYKEHCPVHPFVASSLQPKELAEYILGDSGKKITVPAIIFSEIRSIDLEEKEHTGNIGSMFERDIEHLKECIREVEEHKKVTKTIDRSFDSKFTYQIIGEGIYIAKGDEILFYPMLTSDELKEIDYDWGRSANIFW